MTDEKRKALEKLLNTIKSYEDKIHYLDKLINCDIVEKWLINLDLTKLDKKEFIEFLEKQKSNYQEILNCL